MAPATHKRWLRRAVGAASRPYALALAVAIAVPVGPGSALAQQADDPFLLRGGSDEVFGDGGFEITGDAEPGTDPAATGTDRARQSGPANAQRRRMSVPGGETADATDPPPQGRETRVRRQGPVEGQEITGTIDTGTNPRVRPVEEGTPRSEQVDPFAPAGFRIGSWRAFVRVEQSIGHASNNSFAAGGEPGAFSQSDANVTLRSDWARHEAEITAEGSFRRAYGSADEEIPEASIAGELRLDLIDGFGGVHSAEASAELVRSGGKLDTTLRGSFDRTWYENASLAGGGVLDQSDRDNNLWRVSGRLAYGTTPAIKPFVEAGLGWRIHDEPVDRNGQRRDSTLFDLRAGLEFDLGDKLTGEIAALYINEQFEDSGLTSVDGYGLAADLNWSPERDTVVSFSADTQIEASTTPGNSGSVVNNFATRIERRVRDNFAVNAFGSVNIERFQASGAQDTTYGVGAGIEYWVSRFLSLTGEVEYQQFDAADPASSWDSTSIRVGVALQR